MVKKLYKHEMLYYIRSLLPVYLILFGVALLGRFIEFFEADTTAYSILRGSSIFMLTIAILATLGLSFVFVIVRFYKNMYTGEGYLTLTLPVKPSSHLLVKCTSAVLVNVISVIASVLSVCIFTVGEWLNEIIKAVGYVLNQLVEIAGGHFVFYCLEIIPVCLATTISSVLMYYMCISLGQLFRKNRVLAAVGVYFGLYTFYQVLTTIVSTVYTISAFTWMEELLASWTRENYLVAVHIIFLVDIIGCVIISLVYFLISRYVLTKKLNLE